MKDINDVGTINKLLTSLMMNADFDVTMLRKTMGSIRSKFDDLTESSASEIESKIEAWATELESRKAEFYGEYHGYVAPFVITSTLSWPVFYTICREHFGDQIPTIPLEEPSKWPAISKGSRYVLAFAENCVIGQAQERMNRLIRNISAAAECLRWQHKIEVAAPLDNDPCEVYAIAIPIEVKRPDGIPAFYEFAPKIAEAWKFYLNAAPFMNTKELQNREIHRAIVLLLSGKCAVRLSIALEHFEAAMSLGTSGKEMSKRVANLWKTAALWTALEVASSNEKYEFKRERVRGYVSSLFRHSGKSTSQIDTADNLVIKLYDRRNDVVHEGANDYREIGEFQAMVTTALGIDLSRAVTQAKLSGDIN